MLEMEKKRKWCYSDWDANHWWEHNKHKVFNVDFTDRTSTGNGILIEYEINE